MLTSNESNSAANLSERQSRMDCRIILRQTALRAFCPAMTK
jgi:hypothetical protein